MSMLMPPYSRLSTAYYLARKKLTIAEWLFYLAYAKKAQGPILEPMCGAGRLLIPLRAEGFVVEGFDASAHMLEVLQSLYQKQFSQQALVSQCYAQEFIPQKKYGLIFIPFGSFGLITKVNDVRKTLAMFYQALADDGVMVIEIDTIYSAPKIQNEKNQDLVVQGDGSCISLDTIQSYHEQKQLYRCFCRYQEIRDNVVVNSEDEDFYQYLYREKEFDELLRDSCFAISHIYQDHQRTKAQDNALVRIYEIRKATIF